MPPLAPVASVRFVPTLFAMRGFLSSLPPPPRNVPHPIARRVLISQPRLTPREGARAARLRNAWPLGFPDSPKFRVREERRGGDGGGMIYRYPDTLRVC